MTDIGAPDLDTSSPCERVRASCLSWMNKHGSADGAKSVRHHVTVNRSAIPHLATEILQRHDATGNAKVQWDEEGWHYQAPLDWPPLIRQERMALYILALDAINFCFWPEDGYEYDDLAVSMSSLASQDHDKQAKNLSSVSPSFALSASNLATITVKTMTELLAKNHKSNKVPPDMQQRCLLWNEIGSGLLKSFDGSAWKLISHASSLAPALVQLLVDHFPGFRDCLVEPPIWFLKRAQICVGDWNASLRLNLTGMDRLTTFADYRVPQLLREYNILVYSDQLARAIDEKCELSPGCVEEAFIRAATVVSVEWIVEELNRQQPASTGARWTAVETDWYLWQVGERMRSEIRPHHRVRTTFY